MNQKERYTQTNQKIEDFFIRHAKSLKSVIAPMDVGDYLVAYEEKKYKITDPALVYGRYKSPWFYEEEILDRYADRILFHAVPISDPIMGGDGRFLFFLVQESPESDTHLGLSVFAHDMSASDPNETISMHVNMEVYTKLGSNFVRVMEDNRDLVSDMPDLERRKAGFDSG